MTSGSALVEAFSEWHWASNCFHDHVVHFALQNGAALATAGPAGEHSHLAHDLHRQFREQLEGFVQGFLDHQEATMETFAQALREEQDSDDLCARATVEVITDEVLSLLEFGAFHRTMLRALAAEVAQPEAGATFQALVDADVPEARAVAQSLAEERELSAELYGDGTGAEDATERMLQVVLPDGLGVGEAFAVLTPDGQTLSVVVPEGAVAGQAFEIAYNPAA